MFKLRELTVPEIRKCEELCNFTEAEMKYFKLKASDKSNIQIAHDLHISESQVSNLSRRVRTKIKKVL